MRARRVESAAMEALDEIRAQLYGPDGPFELAEEPVLGQRLRVFKNRRRSLRELVAESAAQGDKEYLVHGKRRVTYEEHARLVASTAHALRELHRVGAGDRVAILAANSAEWVVSFWATVSLGASVAALNGWWTADEVRYGIDDSEPVLLIGDRQRLARIEGDPGVPVVEIESDFAALETHAPDAALPDDPIPEDAPAAILYTSGTTGRPKGAVTSHRGVLGFVQTNLARAVEGMLLAARQGVTGGPPPVQTCTLVTVPLFHMSGLFAMAVMMLATGGKTVYRSGRFDPVDVLRLIESEQVTSWSGLGSMAPRVIAHPDLAKYDVSSVRNLGFGGAPTSPALQERVRSAFPNAANSLGLGYGLSESVSSATTIMGAELRDRPTSVGRPLPTVEVEIRDAEGKPQREGVEGEVHIRSPYVMLEYWRKPDETAASIRPGRWLASGDIGRLEDGYLYINSRARDLILRAAENVYPAEIEHRLDAHPGVAESAVVGVDHPELGQEVKAIVVPAADAELDPEELTRWVGEVLAAFKVPSLWEIRSDPLPRNAAGKVLKNVLQGAATNAFVEE